MAKISNSAIIVICIFGAAAVVCLAWGVYTVIDKKGFLRNPHSTSPEQQAYMREARMRNQEQLAGAYGHGYAQWNGQSYGSYGPGYDAGPLEYGDSKSHSNVHSMYTMNSVQT